MSYFVDTHCHIHDRSVYEYVLSHQKKLTLADFSPEKIFERMERNNVKTAICVGTTHDDSMTAKEFADRHKNIFWSYGIHPEEADDGGSWNDSLIKYDSGFFHDKSLVAIGEVGLDYHNNTYNKAKQICLLEEMIDLALKNKLPIIFHVRDAFDDFFGVLKIFHGVKGVVHSFSDSLENLEKALGCDFYIGVNGLATFTNIPIPPLDKILLETDSPFLAPVPFRGRVNDPSHIKDIADWLAEQKGVSLEEVAKITTKNSRDLFGM